MKWEDFSRQNEIITDRHFMFAFECLHKVMINKLKKNIVLSPYSLYEGLLIMSLMVSGNIEEQLRRILNLSDFTKVELKNYCSYKKVYEWNYTLNISFFNNIKECYIQRDKYLSIERLERYINTINDLPDFLYESPITTMRTINRKINDALSDSISDPVKLSVVRLNMEFIYSDIICLYVPKFEIKISKIGSANTLKISTLCKRKRNSFFSYELSMHVSEFSYEDSTSLYVLLPAQSSSNQWMIKWDATETDISDLTERLSTEDGICKLRKLLDSDTTSENDIALSTWPIFQMERNLKIRELLRVLGVEQLLMPDATDLKVTEEDPHSSVHLGNVVHRAGVKITEKNIVASAITVFYTGQESSPSTKYVEVNYNYPFVWLIYDKWRKSILFAGVFNKFAESVYQN